MLWQLVGTKKITVGMRRFFEHLKQMFRLMNIQIFMSKIFVYLKTMMTTVLKNFTIFFSILQIIATMYYQIVLPACLII